MKLGSLFDGSGGFPLAGVLHGVEPAWASEIEPYPIRVTTARFPDMKHLGDVTKIDGGAVEPVDIITFGSPCQDLSVAGKQAGLHKGERSSLFFEAIRIIKEMREATNGVYPRIAVWENVPGAYSSNKGEDFRAVLQAFCSVKDEAADVPRPAAGKWNPAGAIVGNGWSIAWRTFDAQFWGVPQRRRRIYLIADFGSERAGEILFEQEGLRGDSAESGTAGQGATGDAEGGVGGGVDAISECRGAFETYHENIKTCATLKQSDHKGPQVVCFKERAGKSSHAVCYPINTMVATRWKADDGRTTFGIGDNGDPQFTIGAAHEHAVCYAAGFKYGNSAQAHGIGWQEEISPTLQAGEGGNQKPVVCYALQGNGIDRADTARCNGAGWRENECYTLNTIDRPAVAYSVDCRNMNLTKDHGTLQAKENGGQSLNYMGAVCYALDSVSSNSMKSSNPHSGFHAEIVAKTLQAGGVDPTCNQGGNVIVEPVYALQGNGIDRLNAFDAVIQPGRKQRKYIIRRLTPLECCRLQGFPDYWCSDLGIENPTEDDISFWAEVWETHRKINGASKKPKSRKQIIKWLQNPHSDSAEYKMWGNGIALPNAAHVVGCAVKLIKETQT